MLNRLLNNLHPSINKDPQASPAFIVTGSGTIVIDKDVLQLIGASSAQFSLRSYTLGSLMAAINNVSGFSAQCLVPSSLGASILMSGTYNLPYTIPIFNSFLWQLLKPVALALVDALGAESQALFEMIQNTADGSWLDEFGELFGVVRESGEPDSLYSTRVFNLSVGSRVNNIAIQKTLRDVQYESDVVDSGSAAFTISIQIPTYSPQGFIYSTAQLRDVVDQIRPAGVDYTILSQGTLSDAATISESISSIKSSTAIKYSVRKWGQMVWAG